jgi:phosphate transport system permease protein
MKHPRLAVDVFFKRLIGVVSMFSVLALLAMLLFVFIQGAEPFLTRSANEVRLVVQNIDKIGIDGKEYLDWNTFIPVADEKDSIQLTFENRGNPVTFTINIDRKEADYQRAVTVFGTDLATLTFPEVGTTVISFQGRFPGLEQSVTVLIPEPPYSVFSFLGGTDWRPTHLKRFGILPMIVATLLTTLLAVAIGVPLALLSAVFIADFLPPRLSRFVRNAIDLLAGIPLLSTAFSA